MLILDFDGVLMDSLDEVALTTFNATTGRLLCRLEEAPAETLALFRRNRFHVQPIGDAIPLMAWCLRRDRAAPEAVLSPVEYQALLAADPTPVARRTQQIYETRARLMEKDFHGWLALHRPFQPVWDTAARCAPERIFLLTNKDRSATLALCRHFGLPLLEKNLYSGDGGATKIDNLSKLRRRSCNEGVHFVDDSTKNLQELDEAFNREAQRVTLIYAGWGYGGPKGAAIARRSGFKVFTQDDLTALMARLCRRG